MGELIILSYGELIRKEYMCGGCIIEKHSYLVLCLIYRLL